MRGLSRLGLLGLASMGAALALTAAGPQIEVISHETAARKRRAAEQTVRRGNFDVRAYLKDQDHRNAALAGGGAREVARRQRQLAKIAAREKAST